MVIAALFILVKKWKKSRSPSTDEWINKTCSIYTMECYSAIKGNEAILWIPASIRLNDENMLSEARHKRLHVAWFHMYEIPQTGRSVDKRLVFVGGSEGMENEETANCVWRFSWRRRWSCSKVRWWWQLHKTVNPILKVSLWCVNDIPKKIIKNVTRLQLIFITCNHRNWTTKSKI